MTTSITSEEWDKLSPKNFETAALLRAVDAIDELRTRVRQLNAQALDSYSPDYKTLHYKRVN